MFLGIPITGIVFCLVYISADDGICTSTDGCLQNSAELDENSNRYDEETNKYVGLIREAVSAYQPCQEKNCSCHADTIKQSLHPFMGGISKDMLDTFRRYGTKYQIINHKVYRDANCMFPSRCSGIEYFLRTNIAKIPDLEMIVNTRDWPQISTLHGAVGPVFSFSRTDDYHDIFYPAWSFWEGGPAISLYPTGLGRWDQHRNSINDAAKKWPWQKKKSLGFFRGSRTTAERDGIVLLSRDQPQLVDARYTKNQAWKSPKDTLGAEPAKEVALEEHCQYKYLFNYRGVAASFRFKHLFLCNSLVFHVGDEWREFFYDSLKPWVHYVPLSKNPTPQEIQKMLEFFQKHDALASEIAERGRNHIWNHLKMANVHCYWRKLLKKYAKLLRYEVKRDAGLIEIP